MDTNIMYFLIAVPVLLGVIIWLVLYSRRQHQRNFSQTSIKSQDPRGEKLTG